MIAEQSYKKLENEKKNLEKKLKKFEWLVNGLHDIVFELDSTSHIRFINEAVKRYGWQPDELIGMHILDFIHPGDKDKAQYRVNERRSKKSEILQVFKERRQSIDDGLLEIRFRNRDQKSVSFEVRSNAIFKIDAYGLYENDEVKNENFIGTHGVARDITDRKRTEKALQLSEDRVKLLFNNQTINIVVGPDLKVIDVNKSFLRFLGYEKEEIVGNDALDKVVPEQKQSTRIVLQDCLNQKETPLAEVDIHASDGSIHTFYFGSQEFLLYDQDVVYGILLTGIDVTEFKRTTITLYETQRRLTEIIVNIDQVLFTLDTEGRITYISPAIRNVLGYDPVEMINRPSTRFIYPPDRAKLQQEFEEGKKQLLKLSEYRMLNKDREPIWVYSSTKPFMENGEVKYLFGILTDINERKKTEAALRKSEERYRRTFRDAPIGMSNVALAGRFIDVNQLLCDMVGHSREELLQKTIMEITCLEDRKKNQQNIARLLDGDQSFFNAKTRHLHKDGSTVWCNVNVSLVRDRDNHPICFVGQIEDITKQVQTEVLLRVSEEKATTLIENVGIPITHISPEGKILLINETAAGYLNGKPEDFKGRTVSEVFPFVEQTKIRVAEVLSTGTSHNYEDSFAVQDVPYHIVSNYSPLKDSVGAVYAVQVIYHDITKQTENEKENKKLEQQLYQAQKLEAIGTLAGGIAHDFNNILSTIFGFRQLTMMKLEPIAGFLDQISGLNSKAKARIQKMAESGEKNQGMSEKLEELVEESIDITNQIVKKYKPTLDYQDKIHKAAKRAKELVDQILTFSRKAEYNPSKIDLVPLMKESMKLISATIPKSISVDYRMEAGLHSIRGDSTQIYQVIMNLCTNAVHAMDNKGGQLEITLANFRTSFKSADTSNLDPGDYVKLTISDTGTGMDAEVQKRIYEPFFTTKGKGTGLGLSVVYGIVQKHDGAIVLYSEPDTGTKFDVFFPALIDESVDEPEEETPHLRRGSEHILVVDDEPDILFAYGEMLKNLGYEISAFSQGSDAIEYFKKNPDEIDLVITDLSMPGVNGYELSKEILDIEPETPIVLISGMGDQVSQGELETARIKARYKKPIEFSVIVNGIREILDRNM